MTVGGINQQIKNENSYQNLAFLISEFIKEEDLNEGLKDFMSGLFFINDKDAYKKIKKGKAADIIDREEKGDDYVAAPFAGICKVGNSILIPEEPKYRTNDDLLIAKTAQIFRSAWADKPQAQECLKRVLNHLLRRFFNRLNKKKKVDINLDAVGEAIANGRFKYSSNHSDYAAVKKVYEKINYHKERLLMDLFKNPSDFKNGWSEIKDKLEHVIEVILKTGGDTEMVLGRMKNDNQYQKTKKRARDNKKTKRQKK